MDKKELKTIEYYDKNAQEWVSSRKEGKPSFWLNDIGTFYQLLPCGSILEVGVGGAKEAMLLIEKGYDYIGVDASEGMLAIAHKTLPAAKFVHATVYDLPFDNNVFDGFWTAATLLHIPKRRIDEALKSIHRVVKTGGIGFISLKKGEVEALDDKPTDRWFSYYEEDEFKQILLKNGFEIIKGNAKYQESAACWWLTFFVRSR